MEPLCYSTPSILRCAPFTKLEVTLLIIPTALEVLLATYLLVARWRMGQRRHLWISAEGWIYFVLAIIEMISHILPAAQERADVFKALDTLLGATSFIPIFCYIIFIFLFTRSELIGSLPRRLQTVWKLFVIFIPAIVILNELASFIGISTRTMIKHRPVIALRFANARDQTIWTFLTSLTLAFLTAYQAINFALAFCRLIQAILNQRRIEVVSSDEAHLVRGMGWITGGLLLGVIETVIGFSANGFGSAMTRRVMRLLARACLIVGLIKGLDSAEDFTHLKEELSGAKRKGFRRSVQQFISNPRYSTFRQLTPAASALSSTPRIHQGIVGSHLSRSENGLAGIEGIEKTSRLGEYTTSERLGPQERVTIHFDNGAPKLHMRFSALAIPAPLFDHQLATIAEWAKDSNSAPSRESPPITFHPHSSRSSSLLNISGIPTSMKRASDLHSPSEAYSPSAKGKLAQSSHSTWSTMESYSSLSAVRELTSQFPPLPNCTYPAFTPSHTIGKSTDLWDDNASILSHESQVRSPNSPGPSSDSDTAGETSRKATSRPFNSSTLSNVPDVSADSAMTAPALSSYTPAPATSALTHETYIDSESALSSGKSRAFMRGSTATSHPADWIDFHSIPGAGLPEESNGESHSGYQHSRKSGSMGTLRISWLENPEIEEAQLTRAVSLKTYVARIKSIGKAPIRSTPRPIKTAHAHGSCHLAHIQIPTQEVSCAF
ncbi:hypothetical protein C0991_009491 [Blastosporella zonata]|nr:hypothetical protein C0991_009491 [Blastosporella zonata]